MLNRGNILRLSSKAILLGAVMTVSIAAKKTGITGIVDNVNSALESLISMFSQVAYFAGFLFLIFGIFKFKQHKDNPTQVTVGTPITMLAIGVALMFVGNFITPLGETLFGSNPTAGVKAKEITSGLKA